MYSQGTNGNEDISRYQDRISNFSQEFDLRLFLLIARKSIGWIILFFILAGTAAFVYLRYTPPLFEANTTLQITTQNTAKKVLNVENIYDQDIAGEIEVLRSKSFITTALSKMNLRVSYFAKGKILNYEMYTASPYTVEVRNVNPSLIGIPIYISFPSESKIYTSYHLGDNAFKHPVEIGVWQKLEHTEILITVLDFTRIFNQQNQFQKNPYFFSINNIQNVINHYYRSLNIRMLNQAAQTINVSIRENNAKKASDIVNAIAEEFIEYDLLKKAKSANKVLEFIDDQLGIVYEKLRTSENKMQSFKKQNKLAKHADLLTVYVERLDHFESQLIDLELESDLLRDITATINEKEELDVYNLLPALTGSPYHNEIGDLIANLHRLLATKEEALYTITANSEEAKSLDYQIDVQKRLLVASIEALSNKLITKQENLHKKVKEIEEKFFNLPTQELEYARILRLFTINERFYTSLLEKKAEYSISKAAFVSKNEILERSVAPTVPVSPDKKLIFALCSMVSLILSVGLLLISYLLHDDVTSVQEIKMATSARILGIVPSYKNDIPISQLLVDKNPKSLIAESFRSIRTNLQFISNEPGSKIIAVTSTISGEGKTFVAINLAGIIAFANKKVIIIDLDLRKPKIHLGFNTDNKTGISTILSGTDKVEDIIGKSNVDNLDYITAGPIPINPSELIISEEMDNLLAYLKSKYDMVVIDNPPVGIVTDGISSIQKADYPIYIVKANYSKKSYLKSIDRLINESKIKDLSVIFNGVEFNDRLGQNQNLGYGYGYAYGYGYYSEESEFEKKTFFQRIFRS